MTLAIFEFSTNEFGPESCILQQGGDVNGRSSYFNRHTAAVGVFLYFEKANHEDEACISSCI